MRQIQPARQARTLQKLKGYALISIGTSIVSLYGVANRIFNLDRRGAAANLRRLTQEIENQYDFLFSEYGGRVVPELSSGSPHMDFATVVIEVKDLHIRASRDRGCTDWSVSLNDRPWTPLNFILQRIAPSRSVPYSEYEGLRFHLPEIELVLRSED